MRLRPKTNVFICLSARSHEVAASRSAGIGTYVVVVVDQHGRRKVVAAASQSQLWTTLKKLRENFEAVFTPVGTSSVSSESVKALNVDDGYTGMRKVSQVVHGHSLHRLDESSYTQRNIWPSLIEQRGTQHSDSITVTVQPSRLSMQTTSLLGNTGDQRQIQCLKCEWTVMDSVQALSFKAGRRPVTSLANAAWTASGQRPGGKWDVRSTPQIYVEFNELDSATCENRIWRWGIQG